MPHKDSNSVILDWQSGVPLSHAWFEFADPYAATKLRTMTTTGAFETQRLLMVADLWTSLNTGDYSAIGKRVKPTVSDGPVLIPSHTFQFRPPNEIGNSDDFEISGWRYESVMIVSRRLEDSPAIISHDALPPQKRGPKPIGPLIAAAIKTLRAVDPLFDDRGQEKRIEAIRSEVAKQNPARFPGRTRPGHTTVWEYVTGRKSME